MSEPPTATVPRGTRARYEVTVHRDVRIPTGEDGVTLSADLFLPEGAGPAPALLTVLPYRRDLAAMHGSPMQRMFAARGYASLLVDMRGTGSSGGAPRPPFDPDEVEDALAALAWAADQPWCDGAVGMWGESYGAVMAMRTAARRPAGLRAIVAVQGMLDPERDFAHPGGTRGAAMPLGFWARNTLLAQLLPPLDDFDDPAEQERWTRRLAATPYLLDLFRHGPGDPVWERRRVDASAIEVPALTVAGWRDLFVDGSVRAFERMRGPKRLVAGPWMHGSPQFSPVAPIDFLGLASSWWDRWLRDDGADARDDGAPAVSLRVQGDRPRWLGFPAWPPPGSTLHAAPCAWEHTGPERPDPAAGALSGLWATPDGPFGLPLDQHGDDAGGLCATSPPLDEPLLIGGRPAVTVARPWRRVSVKLADVDPAGRSTLICAGLECVPDGAAEAEIALAPTAYEVAAGHRLRVVLAPGDFPRVWPSLPSGASGRDRPAATALALPVIAERDAVEIDLPEPDPADAPPAPPAGEPGPTAQWEITNDLLNGTTTVLVGASAALAAPAGRGHRLRIRQELTATAHRADPAASSVTGAVTADVTTGSGRRVTLDIALDVTARSVHAAGRVTRDGETLLDRHWRA